MRGSITRIGLFLFFDYFKTALVIGALCQNANIKGYIERVYELKVTVEGKGRFLKSSKQKRTGTYGS